MSDASITKPMRLTSIQALRGVAALAVALLHFAGLQVEQSIRGELGWQIYGWMGVDMFFIVSGFIMVWVTANIAEGTQAASKFLAMRVIRIYPLWFACMILVGIFFYLGNGVPVSIYQIPKEEAWPFFFRSFFLIPQDNHPLIAVGWTLIHELYFYLVFTILLVVGLRSKIFIGLSIWASVTALGLALGLGELSPALDIIFNPLSFLFMAGMVLGQLILRQNQPRFAVPALILGVAVFAALFFTDFDLQKNRVLYLILPFSLIVYGLVSREKITGRAMPNFLTWLGDISYSVYLTHALVIIGWMTFLRPFYKEGLLHTVLPPTAAIVLDTICLLVATIITASVFYYGVERPSLKFFRSRLPSYRAKS
jgi:exopolysaccharide production protein ExoZ